MIALGFLLLFLLGVKVKKSEKLHYPTAFANLLSGLLLYLISGLFLLIDSMDIQAVAIAYISCTAIGFIFILTGGGLLTRLIKNQLKPDIFNKANETFPQEERLLANDYSINLPARYTLKGKIRKSWINFINPMRGLLVIGSPGSGKSYFVVEHVIKQHIEKGFFNYV